MGEAASTVEQPQLALERDYWGKREAIQAQLIQEVAGDDDEKAMVWIDQYGARFADLVDPAKGDFAVVAAIRSGNSATARELIKQKLYEATERPAA